eukprot:scaffold1162_cov170-Amphora_coffeaeformis.AAC.14
MEGETSKSEQVGGGDRGFRDRRTLDISKQSVFAKLNNGGRVRCQRILRITVCLMSLQKRLALSGWQPWSPSSIYKSRRKRV